MTVHVGFTRERLVRWAAWLLAAVLLTTGTWHFASPHGFRSIVPSFLGAPSFWVAVSGVAELAGALGLFFPPTRRLAAWCCALLFVVVFPANIAMAVHALNGHGSVVISLLRLPLQIPLILWAVFIARGTAATPRRRRWSPGGGVASKS